MYRGAATTLLAKGTAVVAGMRYRSDKHDIRSQIMYEGTGLAAPSPPSILSCVIASVHSLHGESATIRSHNVNYLS